MLARCSHSRRTPTPPSHSYLGTTIYKYVPELSAGRDSMVPNARVGLPASH